MDDRFKTESVIGMDQNTQADSYTGQGRFCRNTRHLLKH